MKWIKKFGDLIKNITNRIQFDLLKNWVNQEFYVNLAFNNTSKIIKFYMNNRRRNKNLIKYQGFRYWHKSGISIFLQFIIQKLKDNKNNTLEKVNKSTKVYSGPIMLSHWYKKITKKDFLMITWKNKRSLVNFNKN